MNLVATDETGTRATTITAMEVLVHLRAAAIQYGEARLGFLTSRIGTHSLRAGAAMAMFLAGVPVETIQLIGRWRSQIFMRYIRIQVQQMTKGVADFMTGNPDFFTIEGEEARTDRQRSPRFTGGRPGPRLPPGQPESSLRVFIREGKFLVSKYLFLNLCKYFLGEFVMILSVLT
jgi:hypothetical protein